MAFSDLASLGSFISGVAVAITLVFLVLQLRHSTRTTASQAMGTWLIDYNAILLRGSYDPEFTQLVRDGLADFTRLKLNDQARFHAFMSMLELNALYLFKQLQQGAFDRQFADQVLSFTAAIFKMRGGRQWWELMRRFAAQDFQTYLDGLIQTAVGIDEVMPWFAADSNRDAAKTD